MDRVAHAELRSIAEFSAQCLDQFPDDYEVLTPAQRVKYDWLTHYAAAQILEIVERHGLTIDETREVYTDALGVDER